MMLVPVVSWWYVYKHIQQDLWKCLRSRVRFPYWTFGHDGGAHTHQPRMVRWCTATKRSSSSGTQVGKLKFPGRVNMEVQYRGLIGQVAASIREKAMGFSYIAKRFQDCHMPFTDSLMPLGLLFQDLDLTLILKFLYSLIIPHSCNLFINSV